MKRLRQQWEIYKKCTHLPWIQRFFRFTSGTLDAYHLHLSESMLTNILAIVVGVLSGYGAVGFRWMIASFSRFWGEVFVPWADSFSSLGVWAFLPVPIIGMVLVSLIVKYFAQEVTGSGIPDVMESVALKDGRIRARLIWARPLASAICIGFGGSAGREGPIVHLGAAFGSVTASLLRMSRERRKWLVACGAGAGIAATFNTPIAGVVFAMEIILHGSSLRSFASIVLATVSGSIIGRLYFGDDPAFTVPAYAYESNIEIIFYAILGFTAAAIGILYTKMVYFSEDVFNFTKLGIIPKAAFSGLLIGVIVCIWPEVRGVGYDTINAALADSMVWHMMLVLMVVKTLATSLTLGSGGSGGIFAPALFIGAMLGGTLGTGFEALAPGLTAGVPPYVLVGMAAVFSATTHAPFTAIVTLFEMTGNYNIILPLMLAVVIATVISNHFLHDSIYTMRLTRKGIRFHWGTRSDILESLKVRDIMVTEVDTVRENTTKAELFELFKEKHHNGFPVMDKNNRLVGVVTLNDYHNASRLPGFAPVDKFSTHIILTSFPGDDLSSALQKMRIRDIGRLMVVSKQDPKDLVGIITRTDILKAYEMALRRLQTDDTEMDVIT